MAKAQKIDIGIKDKDRKAIADGLSQVLADTYTLYLKTHNFHWNVTGPMFQTLHLMFETQYNELALAVDLIADLYQPAGMPSAPTVLSRTPYGRVGMTSRATGMPFAQRGFNVLIQSCRGTHGGSGGTFEPFVNE